jgi:ammonia channel protein AmtB
MKIIIIVGLVCLIVNLIVAVIMQEVAQEKGYDDFSHVFAISFFCGIAGWLYVVALPDLVSRKNQEELIELLKSKEITAIDDESEELPEL